MKLPNLSISTKRKKVATQRFSISNVVSPSCSCTEDTEEISDSDSDSDQLLMEEIYDDADSFDNTEEDFEPSDDSNTADPGGYDLEY